MKQLLSRKAFYLFIFWWGGRSRGRGEAERILSRLLVQSRAWISRPWDHYLSQNQLNWLSHPSAPRKRHFNLSCIVEPVVSLVNVISVHELNHCQFHGYLSEIKTEYLDLPYHTAVWWPSSDSFIVIFFELRTNTEIFLNDNNHYHYYGEFYKLRFCCKPDGVS